MHGRHFPFSSTKSFFLLQIVKPYLTSLSSSSMSSMAGSNKGRRGWSRRPQDGGDGDLLQVSGSVVDSKQKFGGSPWVGCPRPQGVASGFVRREAVSEESVSSSKLVLSIPRKAALSAHAVSNERRFSPRSECSTSRGGVSRVHPEEDSSERMSSSHIDNKQRGHRFTDNFILDICSTPSSKAPVLNRSLFAKNREKRLQASLLKNEPQHRRLRPGMFLLEKLLSQEDQIAIINSCRKLAIGHGGFYRPGYDDGARLRLWMMCLGKYWNPVTNQYERSRPVDGVEPPEIPDLFKELVRKAMEASYNLIKQDKSLNQQDEIPEFVPDLCIVNYYKKTGKLGLHQDKAETSESLNKGLPVVSFSIGDSADFLYGDSNNEHMAECLKLESGDVLIFGGKSRHIFHGVSKIHEETSPRNVIDETGLQPGRLNLTFRQH